MFICWVGQVTPPPTIDISPLKALRTSSFPLRSNTAFLK